MKDDIDFAGCMEAVVRALLGEPNRSLSNRDEWRYGTNGSLCVNLKAGTWFDHENQEGGGVLDLIRCKKGLEGHDALRYLQELGCIPCTSVSYDADEPDPFKGATFKKTGKQFRIVKTWAPATQNTGRLYR